MRCVLAAAGAALAAAAIAVPAAAASPTPAAGPAIGGAQLSGPGVLVNYPSRAVPRLPKIKASAWVIADAGTGQVLAARDPHGWYRPASTLKVLTAISLIPALNPNAMVAASKQATTVSPNIVGLLPGIPAERADRAQSVGSGPSVLAAAGFSCVALLAAGIGVAYRRRRSRS